MNISQEVAKLRRMTVTELKARYSEVVGEESRSGHKQYLVRRIAWRIQANAEGGLSERALKRAEELADDADLRLTEPRNGMRLAQPVAPERTEVSGFVPKSWDRRLPPPGSLITRKYRDETLLVKVLTDGFEYEGERYGSLTAIAKAATGSHWNGFAFFGLEGK